MNDTARTTRELLAETDMFGFDTRGWALGLAAGRRAAARRGAKDGVPIFELDELQILDTLNEPMRTADAAPVAAPAAEPAETA